MEAEQEPQNSWCYGDLIQTDCASNLSAATFWALRLQISSVCFLTFRLLVCKMKNRAVVRIKRIMHIKEVGVLT